MPRPIRHGIMGVPIAQIPDRIDRARNVWDAMPEMGARADMARARRSMMPETEPVEVQAGRGTAEPKQRKMMDNSTRGSKPYNNKELCRGFRKV